MGLDSSEPDVNEGRVGRDRYGWIAQQFDDSNDIRIVTVHHHLVPIPGTVESETSSSTLEICSAR